jgi:hypothetical protein
MLFYCKDAVGHALVEAKIESELLQISFTLNVSSAALLQGV